MILFLSGCTRPLKSDYFPYESLYPLMHGSSSEAGMGAQSMKSLLLDLFKCLYQTQISG